MLTVGLAAAFSSPDDPPTTLATWARADPKDFVTAGVSELDGSSGTAGYGPPYNSAADGQKIGPIPLAKIAGVQLRINAAEDLVLQPPDVVATGIPTLQAAIATWRTATADEQQRWTHNYTAAITQASFEGSVPFPTGDYGPVEPMLAALLATARSRALDGQLASSGGLYHNDYTRPLLFLGDGTA